MNKLNNMESLINTKYDKVVCINLKERPDKKEYMDKRFEEHNIKVEYYHPVILGYAKHFVEPYADKVNDYSKNWVLFNKHFPNEFGTMHSHYYVIKSALLEGVENLFVFEDDCAFHKDWDTLLLKYLNTIPENTDGILLYSYMSNLEPQNIRVARRWTKGFASWSFVAYGMNRKAMQGYVDLMDKTPMIADRGSWHMMTFENYNFFVASPPLVLPSKEFDSNIRGANKNYENTKSVFVLGIDENLYK